ncbi:phosphate acyltransferase [Candidatus Poribacteria bacterium]
MSFMDHLVEKAQKGQIVTIILPEYITEVKMIEAGELDAEDAVFLKAGEQANKDGIAKIILPTPDLLEENDLMTELGNAYDQKRSEEAEPGKKVRAIGKRMIARNVCNLGAQLVASGYAHGVVMGKYHPTRRVIEAAKLCIGEAPEQIMSTISFFDLPAGIGLPTFAAYADIAINIDPTAEELAKIISTSVSTYQALLGEDPVVCVASHETHTGEGNYMDRAREAMEIYSESGNAIETIDGPCQLDAAFHEKIGNSKGARFYEAGWGVPNLVIFTNLDSGNTNYKTLKLISDSAGLKNNLCTQGSGLPVDDLSRGDEWQQVYGSIAVNALKCQQLLHSGAYGELKQLSNNIAKTL